MDGVVIVPGVPNWCPSLMAVLLVLVPFLLAFRFRVADLSQADPQYLPQAKHGGARRRSSLDAQRARLSIRVRPGPEIRLRTACAPLRSTC